MNLSYNFDFTKAILVGASEFEDPNLPPLPTVKNNILKLKEVLGNRSIVGIPNNEIYEILDEKHSSEIGKKIKLIARDCFDTFIFYYAGHGKLSDVGELHLTVRKTDTEALELTALPIKFLKKIIQDCPAAKKIVIIDSCFSGNAIDFMGSQDDVRNLTLIEGTYLITSVPPNNLAKATDNSGNFTAFTGSLIACLEKGLNNSDEFITINSLYNAVRTASSSFNTPHRAINQNIDDFRFAFNKGFIIQEEFVEIDNVLTSTQSTTIARISLNLLKEIEKINGEHLQRFVVMKPFHMAQIGLKDGDWAEVEARREGDVTKEYVRVYGRSSIIFSIIMPLVIRNLLDINNLMSMSETEGLKLDDDFYLTIKKAELAPLSSWEVSDEDFISWLPSTPEMSNKVFDCPLIAVRNLEFDLLNFAPLEDIWVECYNEIGEKYESKMKVVKYADNPGRAVVGIEKQILEREIFRMEKPFKLRIQKMPNK
jgi:hypothetical protein